MSERTANPRDRKPQLRVRGASTADIPAIVALSARVYGAVGKGRIPRCWRNWHSVTGRSFF